MLESASTALTETTPEPLPHWLRLSKLPFSSKLINALLEYFDNEPQAIFEASDNQMDSIPCSRRATPSHCAGRSSWRRAGS